MIDNNLLNDNEYHELCSNGQIGAAEAKNLGAMAANGRFWINFFIIVTCVLVLIGMMIAYLKKYKGKKASSTLESYYSKHEVTIS